MRNKLRNRYIPITPMPMLPILRNARRAQSNPRPGTIIPITHDLLLKLVRKLVPPPAVVAEHGDARLGAEREEGAGGEEGVGGVVFCGFCGLGEGAGVGGIWGGGEEGVDGGFEVVGGEEDGEGEEEEGEFAPGGEEGSGGGGGRHDDARSW